MKYEKIMLADAANFSDEEKADIEQLLMAILKHNDNVVKMTSCAVAEGFKNVSTIDTVINESNILIEKLDILLNGDLLLTRERVATSLFKVSAQKTRDEMEYRKLFLVLPMSRGGTA